jgi:hypothetical protein
MSTSRRRIGEALYAALGAGDAGTLRTLLAEDFVGDQTPGLPHEYGAQVYQGLAAMLTDGWGRVWQGFAMRPEPEEILVTDDYIEGRGNDVGTAVSTGKPVKARFAHFWRVEEDEIVSVVQVTDSATWQRALT